MKKIITSVVLLLILNASVSVYAGLLGQINFSDNGGTRVVSDSFYFRSMCGNVGFGESYSFRLFGHIFPSDIGVAKRISPIDPDFDTFISVITNGQDDFFLHNWGYGGGCGGPESHWINKCVESFGPDLCGYQITEVAFTLNSGFLNTPGGNPNRDGIWTDYSYDVTYSFYGELIPEPTTLLLLGFGALVLRERHIISK